MVVGVGLAATLVMMTASLLALFSNSPIAGYTLFILPIAVQEMVLAVWLLVAPRASVLGPSCERSRRPADGLLARRRNGLRHASETAMSVGWSDRRPSLGSASRRRIEAKRYAQLLFRTRTGSRPSQSNWVRSWHRALATLGLPPLRVYDCRHAAAATWLRSGVPLGETARRLGHSVETLVSTYVGALQDDETISNAKIESFLNEPTRDH